MVMPSSRVLNKKLSAHHSTKSIKQNLPHAYYHTLEYDSKRVAVVLYTKMRPDGRM